MAREWTCPECGEAMGVSGRRFEYKPRLSLLPATASRLDQGAEAMRDMILARTYCTADCLLDARARGYPKHKFDSIAKVMQPGDRKGREKK